MRQGILIGSMLMLLSVTYGQKRDSVATVVSGAPLSHPMHASIGGVELRLRGVYVHEGLMWFGFDARNGSSVDFRTDGMRFWLQARHTVKRQAQEELRWMPVYGNGPGILRSDSSARFVSAVPARAPFDGQVLRIEWVERNGDRRIRLYVPAKRLLRARKVMVVQGEF